MQEKVSPIYHLYKNHNLFCVCSFECFFFKDFLSSLILLFSNVLFLYPTLEYPILNEDCKATHKITSITVINSPIMRNESLLNMFNTIMYKISKNLNVFFYKSFEN